MCLHFLTHIFSDTPTVPCGGICICNYYAKSCDAGFAVLMSILMCMEMARVTWRKQNRPGIAPNNNTTHVTTARSSADLTKRNQTPPQYTLATDTTILQTDTPPQAAASQRTHVARTQGCGRIHPVNRRVTTQDMRTERHHPLKVWTQRQARSPP